MIILFTKTGRTRVVGMPDILATLVNETQNRTTVGWVITHHIQRLSFQHLLLNSTFLII